MVRLVCLRVLNWWQVDYGGTTSCTIEWPDDGLITSDRTFVWYAFTLAFAIPVILISIFYSLVVIQIRTAGPISSSSTLSANRRHSRRRVTRMVLAVITVYIVCWLPYWVFQVTPAPLHAYTSQGRRKRYGRYGGSHTNPKFGMATPYQSKVKRRTCLSFVTKHG